MKLLIAALNSKFVHLSLAPWYLKAACHKVCNISVLELTINMERQEIVRRIYREKPDAAAFSCYIFNIEKVEAVIRDLKQILPDLTIILGGPEVTFNAGDVLRRNENADYVVCGEGEQRLARLLEAIKENKEPKGIDGIAYRSEGKIIGSSPESFIKNLDDIPSPYTEEMLTAAKGKIAYFEASRGCPFHCAYCLSGQAGGVRRFSPERVKSDLKKLMLSQARQIKFVDRTFNSSLKTAKSIVSFILEAAKEDKTGTIGGKNYHFEAAADLFDPELIALLSSAPAGLFQLEIGIQSFNEKTLAAATRKTDLAKCEENIRKLVAAGNMHIHLDLIAGLPYEGFESFAESFNRIFALHPECIQLGFLKLLYGSALRGQADDYGFRYSPLPPYEVMETPWLCYDDMLRLKGVETAVDSLYNSGRFQRSIFYIITLFDTPFNFFFEFSKYLNGYYPDGYGIPSRKLYDLLLSFVRERFTERERMITNELLKFDFFISDNSCNPPKSLLRTELPNARALYESEKNLRSRIHFERFAVNPFSPQNAGPCDIRFSYEKKNPVSGQYSCDII